jgi:predicted DNA-binding transcriptional regulator AlpA
MDKTEISAVLPDTVLTTRGMAALGLGRKLLRRLERMEGFPKARVLGRRKLFIHSEVMAWFKAQPAGTVSMDHIDYAKVAQAQRRRHQLARNEALAQLTGNRGLGQTTRTK